MRHLPAATGQAWIDASFLDVEEPLKSNAVELADIVKQFPNPAGGIVNAVDHVSFQVRDGEFFSLLGPSGCGKTTTLRMIAGFEYPTQGRILLHGKDIGQTPPHQRNVNTVFQHYALFPHMTVGQNVGFGLEMKSMTRAEIDRRVGEALDMVRLAGLEKRRPSQLSGGQQQRVAVARALINRPEVLLLDEPLGALDLKLRKEMQLELKTLQREVGITFIYVTHDQEEAMTMSDRIMVMNHGKALQLGSPAEVYERPNSRYVADFIGETNFIDGVLKTPGGGTAVEVECAGGLSVQAVGGAGLPAGAAVTVAVRPERIAINRGFDNMNCFAGQVTDLVYIGTDTYYTVRLEGGQALRVREQNADPTERVLANVGDKVQVTLKAESAVVLVE
ncbi:MAG: ABC transporter ATP-binding protein [Chloroflexi bacterium]|nr:ABC transporter ATP-binding protein [Chloroflexota bacterium]